MLLLLCWFNLFRSTRISYLLTFESFAYIGFTLSRSFWLSVVEECLEERRLLGHTDFVLLSI